MQFSCIGIPGILRRFKIVEYEQYPVAWWQHLLQRLHITYISYLSDGVVHVTIEFAAIVFVARNDEFDACSAVSLALTHGLLVSNSLRTVGESRLAPKMSIAVRTRDSNPCRYTRWTRHAVATCLVASVRHIARIPLAARFTHIPFDHGCCQVPYHMMCHIVIQVQSFG